MKRLSARLERLEARLRALQGPPPGDEARDEMREASYAYLEALAAGDSGRLREAIARIRELTDDGPGPAGDAA